MDKCSGCGKEIDPEWDKCQPFGLDGDYVCNDKCKALVHKEMDAIAIMTDKQFESWMLGA